MRHAVAINSRFCFYAICEPANYFLIHRTLYTCIGYLVVLISNPRIKIMLLPAAWALFRILGRVTKQLNNLRLCSIYLSIT